MWLGLTDGICFFCLVITTEKYLNCHILCLWLIPWVLSLMQWCYLLNPPPNALGMEWGVGNCIKPSSHGQAVKLLLFCDPVIEAIDIRMPSATIMICHTLGPFRIKQLRPYCSMINDWIAYLHTLEKFKNIFSHEIYINLLIWARDTFVSKIECAFI